MGLDIAEIMIVLEEEFLIEFTGAEFPNSDMVGDLVDNISKKILALPVDAEEATQLLSASRKRVSDYLQNHLNINTDLLQDDTPLEKIFPLETRYQAWCDLRQAVSTNIPSLEGSVFSCVYLFVIPAAIAITGGAITKYFSESLGGGIFAGIALFVLSVLGMFWLYMSLLSDKYYTMFPSRCKTISHLIRWSISFELRLDPDGHLWTEKTIDERVRAIIAAAAGVQPNEINRETRISKLF